MYFVKYLIVKLTIKKSTSLIITFRRKNVGYIQLIYLGGEWKLNLFTRGVSSKMFEKP